MHARLSFLAVCVLTISSSAPAQIDGAKFTAEFRQKYGPAIPRETFLIRPGLRVIVDYASNGHVCRLQLPPTAPSTVAGVEKVRSGQAIDDFLVELLPISMRGKELRKGNLVRSRHSASHVEYENITVSEDRQDERRTGVTVAFRNEQCQADGS